MGSFLGPRSNFFAMVSLPSLKRLWEGATYPFYSSLFPCPPDTSPLQKKRLLRRFFEAVQSHLHPSSISQFSQWGEPFGTCALYLPLLCPTTSLDDPPWHLGGLLGRGLRDAVATSAGHLDPGSGEHSNLEVFGHLLCFPQTVYCGVLS